jgi:hypothetical protein
LLSCRPSHSQHSHNHLDQNRSLILDTWAPDLVKNLPTTISQNPPPKKEV